MSLSDQRPDLARPAGRDPRTRHQRSSGRRPPCAHRVLRDARFLRWFPIPAAVSGDDPAEARGVCHLTRWPATGNIAADASRHGGRGTPASSYLQHALPRQSRTSAAVPIPGRRRPPRYERAHLAGNSCTAAHGAQPRHRAVPIYISRHRRRQSTCCTQRRILR